jgi:hypothetical protein
MVTTWRVDTFYQKCLTLRETLVTIHTLNYLTYVLVEKYHLGR